MIIRKTPEEIEKIAASGAIVVRTLRLLERQIRPGVTTAELDAAAERYIRSQGGVPTFKGYRGFPASICASPNSMIVHGIPGPYALERGDVISLDVGVTLDGWVADAARTFSVGLARRARAEAARRHRRRSLMAGVEQCVVGNRLGDVSHAIQVIAEGAGLAIVRTLVGHGVGRNMHEDPQIPNFGEPGTGPRLLEGMVLAIEPMTTAGGPGVRVRQRRLVDLFAGRLAHRALRVHGRDHRRRAARDDAVAPWPTASEPQLVTSEVALGSADPGLSVRNPRAVAAAARLPEPTRPEPSERDHEGTTVGQADVREVQDRPPPRQRAGDLHEPAPQAAAGLAPWHASPASTCRSTSASRSA